MAMGRSSMGKQIATSRGSKPTVKPKPAPMAKGGKTKGRACGCH